MIFYEGSRFHARLLLQLRGSVFVFAFLVAIPCSALSVVIKIVSDIYLTDEEFAIFGLSDSDQVTGAAFSAVSSLLGFLIVFRTSQAYSRFWEGCTMMHEMLGEWFDATSSLVAFCKMSEADKHDVVLFQHTLVRLVSLLNAVVLVDLSSGFDGVRPGLSARAFELELIDAEGIDTESLATVNDADEKVELIFQWIQQLVVESSSRGIFSVGPPILSRAFQELANGMVKYHNASKIAHIPLPFPYMQTMELMLVFHWAITPFLTSIWVQTPIWAGVLTFMQVFFFWSLNCIAGELENPFGEDVNDLPAEDMQLHMNRRLLLLLRPSTQRTPHLSDKTAFDETADPDKPQLLRLGTKTNLGKGGVALDMDMASKTAQNRLVHRRISLGSLTEAVRDVSRTAFQEVGPLGTFSDPDSGRSRGGFRSKSRTPTVNSEGRLLCIGADLEPLDMNASVWNQQLAKAVGYGSPQEEKERDSEREQHSSKQQVVFQEQILQTGESLSERVQDLLAACEEIRDRMRGWSDTERLLSALGSAAHSSKISDTGRMAVPTASQTVSARPPPTAPNFCCTTLRPPAPRKVVDSVSDRDRRSSFSAHP